jgi:hypothetical protein
MQSSRNLRFARCSKKASKDQQWWKATSTHCQLNAVLLQLNLATGFSKYQIRTRTMTSITAAAIPAARSSARARHVAYLHSKRGLYIQILQYNRQRAAAVDTFFKASPSAAAATAHHA